MTNRAFSYFFRVAVFLMFTLSSSVGFTSESDDPAPSAAMTAFLQGLEQQGHKLQIIDRSNGEKGSNKVWEPLLKPTFPMGLSFETSSHVVFQDESIEYPIALFIFYIPKSLDRILPSFQSLTIKGILTSKVQTYYQVISNRRFFAILLTEDHELDSASQAVSQLLGILQSALNIRPASPKNLNPQ